MDLRARLDAFTLARSDRAAQRIMERRSILLKDYYGPIWRQLAEFTGLCHGVDVASGKTVVTPRLVAVDCWGPNPVLVVQLLPGQLLADLRKQSERLAPRLGAKFLRMTPRGEQWVRIELMQTDPLDVPVEVAPSLQRVPDYSVLDHPVMVAQTEAGARIWLGWADAPNAVIQGATRSGKSVWCYSVLGQLARCHDVLIAGSDPSGILLGRPYEGTEHRDWQAVGSSDVMAHLAILRKIVAEMDRRILTLPPRVDKIGPTSDQPLLICVLEEFAGLLRLASTLATPRGEAKVVDQLRALFGRLVSEGHKVAIRLLVISQRADATIIGGFERGQLGLRVSFRVTDPEALVMIHPEGRDFFAEHSQAPAGVALFETVGHPLTRVRGPRLTGEETDYAAYWDEIATVTACRQLAAA